MGTSWKTKETFLDRQLLHTCIPALRAACYPVLMSRVSRRISRFPFCIPKGLAPSRMELKLRLNLWGNIYASATISQQRLGENALWDNSSDVHLPTRLLRCKLYRLSALHKRQQNPGTLLITQLKIFEGSSLAKPERRRYRIIATSG